VNPPPQKSSASVPPARPGPNRRIDRPLRYGLFVRIGRVALVLPGGRILALRRAAAYGAGLAALGLVGVAVVARIGSRTLELGAHERAVQEAHGTWARMFSETGLVERFPIALWVLALAVVGLIGLPYVWLAAASLPDRGFALARPIGLLLVTWLVWWAASLRLLPFTRGTIACAAAVVGVGAAAIASAHRRELVAWARTRWRLLAAEEALFWTLFAAFALIRWSNPDLWHPTLGGEKPMDLAYLNAVVKSTHFPPFDPWFAGGQMNYYYLGFVLVGVLVKATSIVPTVAYNLAVPTLAACLGAATFTATLALVDRPRRHGRLLSSTLVALLGALLATVLGNLGELRVLRQSLQRSVPIEWWYWNPSRVIHHPPTEPGVITEFPSFTYLYADLHAHAMALPFTATALALSFAILLDRRELGRGSAVLLFGLLALVLGALWPLNTWDFPTYVLVALVALNLAGLRRAGSASLRALLGPALQGLLLVALAYVAFLPFHRAYDGVFDGVARWHGSRTPLNDYLTIHGLFLYLIGSALVLDFWTSRDANGVVRTVRLSLRSWDRIGRFRQLRRLLVERRRAFLLGSRATAAGLLAAGLLALAGLAVPALVVALGTVTALALVRRRGSRDDSSHLRQMALVLVFVGLALTLAVEFLVARNIDVGRTNTVFKLYLQVWILWSVAGAVAVASVYERLSRLTRAARVAWRLGFIALLGAAALYPLLATRAKVDDRFDSSVGRTLDGTAFMERAVFTDHDVAMRLAYDREAIRWLQAKVVGSPVVGEMNTSPTLYGWGNRFAMFTGNPAIVGWDYHQRQQRPKQSEQVTQRIKDVQTAYGTTKPDVAYDIFRRYGVEYFVVGQLERAYLPAGQAKWAAGAGRLWTLVHINPETQIYRMR
jgi:YYY domain-containing protein